MKQIPVDDIVLGCKEPMKCFSPLDIIFGGAHAGSVMLQTRCLVASGTFGSGKFCMFSEPKVQSVLQCLVAFVSSVVRVDDALSVQSPGHGAEASCIYLRGATGSVSQMINGAYDMTTDVADGYHIYGKRDGDGMVIEHNCGRWGVKHLQEIGTPANLANVQGGCAINACMSRVWRVGDTTSIRLKENLGSRSYSGGFFEDPNITMLVGPDAEREVPVQTLHCILAPFSNMLALSGCRRGKCCLRR